MNLKKAARVCKAEQGQGAEWGSRSGASSSGDTHLVHVVRHVSNPAPFLASRDITPLQSPETRGRNAPEVEKICFASTCFLQFALVAWDWDGASSGGVCLVHKGGAWSCLSPPWGVDHAGAASRGLVRHSRSESSPG